MFLNAERKIAHFVLSHPPCEDIWISMLNFCSDLYVAADKKNQSQLIHKSKIGTLDCATPTSNPLFFPNN